jgi:predicted MPP superfamily phosphohydrolase
LHFTGRIGISYFQEVVRICNDLQPDLVAITGDLVDEEDCIDWIPETLGQLKATHGVYYVLGNHDLRVDTDRLRRTLANCGLIGLAHHEKCLNIRGQTVCLLGNELPWIASEEVLDQATTSTAEDASFRIGLVHTPDQLSWARKRQIDLLLAGHTHGGQIRIPPFGPIFSPTFGGVRYATGVFYRPPTTLHVSRGISSDLPIRWNCPPELALLTLRSPATHGVSVSHG